MKFITNDLPTITMDTRKATTKSADADAKGKRLAKSSLLSSQCKIIANEQGLDASKIECCNLPSFKSDTCGLVYHCIHCDKSFYDCETVKDHLGAVHCDFHYHCEYCGEFFSTHWQLKRHKNRYTHNCDHCDYSTNRFSQFREHSRRAHEIKLKPKYHIINRFNKAYECDICGYQVLRPHMYRKHMITVHKKDVDDEC